MQLTIEQAEQQLHTASVKESTWQSGVGCRFRIYKAGPEFDISTLPPNFEVLWIDEEGYEVICEWQYF